MDFTAHLGRQSGNSLNKRSFSSVALRFPWTNEIFQLEHWFGFNTSCSNGWGFLFWSVNGCFQTWRFSRDVLGHKSGNVENRGRHPRSILACLMEFLLKFEINCFPRGWINTAKGFSNKELSGDSFRELGQRVFVFHQPDNCR